MTQYFQRLLFMTLVILSSSMLFSLCGCARLSGVVMNESGQAYYARGNYTRARQEFQKALIDDPTNANYAFNLAAAAQKQGDYALAERGYRQALSLNPSYQPAYHGLASMMLEQGRADEAEQLLSAWAGSQPYEADSYVEMAWLQRELGDPASAEQTLRQALRVNPQHDRAIAQLGQVYEEQGRLQDAATMYQRSLYLDPTQKEVKARMASLEEQLPTTVSPGGMQAPTMMAGMPMFSPGMMNRPQMASSYRAAYPPQAYPNMMVHGSTMPGPVFGGTNMPIAAGYSSPVPAGQSQSGIPASWETSPHFPQQVYPTMPPSAGGVVQHQEHSSQPTTLVMPPESFQQTPSSSIPQISQNIPEVRPF